MAIYETLSGRITDTNVAWQDKSGQHVEDFICQSISDLKGNDIKSGNYNIKDTMLNLVKVNGDVIPIEISVVPPTYNYGLKIFGIKIGDVPYDNTDITHIIQSNTEVSLLVGVYGTIQTVGDPIDRGGQINAIITYQSSDGKTSLNTQIGLLSKNSFTYNTNGDIIGITVDPVEIPIKDLFTEYQENGSITVKLLPNSSENVSEKSTTSVFKITCEVPTLTYSSDSYNISGSEVSFTLKGGTNGNYILEGYNNGEALSPQSNLTYKGITPGLNSLVVRAKHKTSNITSNWVYVDLIGTTDCTKTVVAVNGVSSGIINNGVAQLYHLTVYSPNKEEITLTTYLESAPGLIEGTDEGLIKQETISSYTYDSNNLYKTSYKKYIEEETSGSKYLMVSVEGKYYTFYVPTIFGQTLVETYKQMNVEKPNTNFMYYKEASRIYNYDQITGQTTNVFSKDNLDINMETTDGWGELDGICYFRTSAQTYTNGGIFKSPLNLSLQQSTGYSFEFGFKTSNISNKSKPVLTIGKLQIWPTQIVWWNEQDTEGEQSSTFTSRNSQFQEGVDTHVMITVHPDYKLSNDDPYYPRFLQGNQEKFDQVANSYSFNLVRIYINGVIDRGFILNDSELSDLTKSTLQICPTTSDVDWYLIRIYNNKGLEDTYVQKNYNSFIFNKDNKLQFFNHNNILGSNGAISFNKARQQQNTIVLVLPKGLTFPNYTWDKAMSTLAESAKVTQYITYADPLINQQFGGRITNGQIKGQGSSAKRYLIWNVQNSFGKYKDDGFDSEFTSFSVNNFDSDTNRFKATATVNQRNQYVMPTYEGQVDKGSKVKKSVGKVNWASSMQSHKIGSCKLYEDAYKTRFPNTVGNIGKKAVHEEPFLYFYWETDLDDVSTIELSDLISNDTNLKFAGFQTWGAGKGDKYESGYGDDTPEYLMLEGGENANVTVNFRCPWHALQGLNEDGKFNNTPTVSKTDSLSNPEMGLVIEDESIVYQNQGAWDIDFGCDEYEKDKFRFEDTVLTSLKRFREFYDFVYEHDFSYVLKTGASCDANDFTREKEDGTKELDTKHKYLVTVPEGKFTINGVVQTNYKPGDMYRYDVMQSAWVPAGLFCVDGQWERYNVYEKYPEASGIIGQIPLYMKQRFLNGIAQYIDIDDIAFHQAFIKFVSGTDNRAKNTYFQIIGPKYIEVGEDQYERPEIVEGDWSDYKIRLIGDDLDTIFVTDNSGLQSKPYNLLEASYDPSFESHWGDAHNVFLYMFDQCFESRIIDNLKQIISTAFGGKDIEDKTSYFYKTFFKVQEDFPAVAYNHTSRLYYENAYIIKENKVIPGYENNLGVDPIGQIHGSCLPCEKQFMTERLNFLNGYAQTNLQGYYSTNEVGGGTKAMKIALKFTPYQDFYPNYGYGAAGGEEGIPYYILNNKSGIVATSALAKKDVKYDIIIDNPTEQTYQGIYQTHMFKTLDMLGSYETSLPSLERGTEIHIDNNTAPSGIKTFKLTSFDGNYPVLENLTFKNVELPDTLPLDKCNKLKSVNLSESKVRKVVLPISGRLQELLLPATITDFEIYNNPGLKSVEFEGYDNISNVYIDGNKCGEFDLSNFCENIPTPVSITLKNLQNVYLTEETLLKLLVKNCEITGEITIVNSIGSTDPKDISLSTKQQLVNMFGDIVNGTNGLKINFKQTKITQNFNYNSEVSAYYNTNSPNTTQSFGNLFGISVNSGNDVIIVNETNPFNSNVTGYLDISYNMPVTNNATIDSKTGTITLTGPVDSDVTVTITMHTLSGQSYERKSIVSFKWKSPSIGNFAYADGTFSSNFNPSKTLVGLVYDKVGNENSGKVYIIGKEYANKAHYSGYSSGYGSNQVDQNTTPFYIYKLNEYVSDLSLGTYQPNITSSGITRINNIMYTTNVYNLQMTGKTDTLAYVNLVNVSLFENKKDNSFINSQYVTNTNGKYSITSIQNLNALCEELEQKGELRSSLLYPYFYSAYLYEPEVKIEETIDDQYRKGNWYMPSVGELSKIIYYRGYSAGGSRFVSSDVRQTINNTIKGDAAIFSKALLSMTTAHMPSVWNNIVGSGTYGTSNNITTSVTNQASDADNYSYQVYQTWDNNSQYIYESQWVSGGYSTDWYGDSRGRLNAWRYTLHQGIPFTEYNYTNPLNN